MSNLKIVIPARLHSTRLPRKPLQLLAGRPLIEHTYRRALEAEPDEVIVATDSDEIAAHIDGIGGISHISSLNTIRCGTDRISETAQAHGWSDDTPVINLQCDEPGLPATALRALGENLEKHDHDADICTLAAPLTPELEGNPQNVTVVVDANDMALYFSRHDLPFTAEDADDAVPPQRLHHIGVYAYRVGTLKRFTALPQCEAERSESLEQLRALHNGMSIHIGRIASPEIPGIDTEDDLAFARKCLEK